ncbi:hypothetical protein SCMU_27940 [Sinomonas cyclohexanicum]|uniref:DUF5671 domain-containing protein n=1 Tax=Sinomonas cyclohexanicum TaxID=322009 RepID=A0ABM7PXC8_SINCY|nr:DUF5671 domain-containing protein [Corynebacterium cyclohexanicum]BCT76952.1 hypothetical protein SCMU_27940 [Corynebacterium cyclohexanicum]
MSAAQQTVRRLIVYLLLFALVVIAAIGLSGLLTRALDMSPVLVGSTAGGLALSLAFTVIGGPLAAVLWWFLFRRLGDQAERSALSWGLYIAGLYTAALVTAASELLALLASLTEGRTQGWNGFLAIGLVWLAVWLWHRWMWRHPGKGPLRLPDVPAILGAAYGLVLGASMAAAALGGLLEQAVGTVTGASTIAGTLEGVPWWRSVLASVIWAAGGALVWIWHWYGEGGRRLRTGLSDVALVLVGIFGAGAATLGGAGTALFVVLRLLFDRGPEPLALLLEPLPPALAAAAAGGLVWAYHWPLVAVRGAAARQAARLVTAGVAVVGAASGIGVIVNAVLSLATPTLAGTNALTLLLGGIASLAVGGTVWWLVWKPTRALSEPVSVRPAGRRVYLVVIFGVSAVAALVTLLVIGYQVFQFALSAGGGVSLVGRVRAPLGILVATALAAGYHFAVWRHDRAALSAVQGPRRTGGRVFLVTSLDPAPFARAIEDATGATVKVWRRAEAPAGAAPASVRATLPPAGDGEHVAVPAPAPEDVARALSGIVAKRVLVLVGPAERIEVVSLED